MVSSDSLNPTMESGMVNIASNEQLSNTLRTLNDFREKSIFTDVILCAGNEELSCHKAVLAASSNYFYAMFSSPYKEQETSYVVLDHISPWALRRLLEFIYLGELELTPATVQDVLTAASLMDYPVAVKACVDYIEAHLDITNCLGVEALADLHGFTNLHNSARKLAMENFSSVILESTEWVTLPISSVISYISSNEVDVPSEKFIWDACMTWINYEPELRATYLPHLLSFIRLKHLGRNFLQSELKQNPLIYECKKSKDIIKEFLCYEEQANSSEEMSNHFDGMYPNDQPPRPATLKRPTLVVLGGLNNSVLNCMQSFSSTRTCWQSCPSMPVDNLAWFSVTVIANTLFVIGGIKAGSIMDTVYIYSPVRNNWSQKKSLPEGRARHCSVAVGSRYIFVFGGLTMSTDHSNYANTNCQQYLGQITSFNVGGVEMNSLLHNESVLQQDLLPSGRSNQTASIVNSASKILRYDLCNDSWTVCGQTDQSRLESHIVLIPDSSSLLTDNTSSNMQLACQNDLDLELIDSNNSGRNVSLTRRRHSSHSCLNGVFIEIGGISELNPRGTDQVSFYRLRTDSTVFRMPDYIKLPQPARYVNCAAQQDLGLVYIFWEETSELSVLDIRRHNLHTLAPLALTNSRSRIYSGLAWVGELLYVMGGFAEFVGDDRRPTMPRDDIHCYNPASNSWSVVKASNTTVPRAVFGCVCLCM